MADNTIELIVKVIDEATSQLEKLGSTLTGLGKLAGAALGGFSLKEVIDASIEAQNATFLLANAIQATGLAGTDAQRALSEYAEQVQRTTIFSDNAAKAVEAMGLRLGLSVDVIRQATEAAANLAAANPGQSLEQAGAAVTRALADPLRGIQNLRREHVIFNQEQQFTIEQLAKTGHEAEAQAKILEILASSYRGAAQDARNTLGGALQALKNNFSSLLELQSGQSSGLVKMINDLSGGLVTLKEAINGTLAPQAELSDGMKIFAGAVVISIEEVRLLASSLVNTLGAAFRVVGTLAGGIGAALAQAWDFKAPHAGEHVKEILEETFSEVGDIISKGAGDTRATLDASITNIMTSLDRLWNQAARAPQTAIDATVKGGSAKVQASLEQLRAINAAELAVGADIEKMVVQASAPFDQLQQRLYETEVRAKLLQLGIKDLPPKLKELLDTLRDARGDAGRTDVLRGLEDASAQLEIQAALGNQAADAIALYAANLQLAAAGAKDLDDQIKKAVERQQLLKNDVVIKGLQDQLALERLTTNEKEKQQNLLKLGKDATAEQKAQVEALTEQLQVTRNQTTAVNSLQDAFESMFEHIRGGARDMINVFANAFEQILAKALAVDLVHALGLDKLSGEGGGSSGLGAVFSALGSAIFGHAGGTTGDSGPFWAGEGGMPELVIPGANSASVWNQRQLAFNGAGGGANVNYAPVNNVQIVANDADQTKAELFRFFAVQSAKDKAELYRQLARNGVGPRSGLR